MIKILIIWFVILFCLKWGLEYKKIETPKYKETTKFEYSKQSTSERNEDLKAFFFGASPFGSTKDSQPVNEDYDKGPEW